MKTWITAGVVVIAATALLSAAAFGAFSTGERASAGPVGIAIEGKWEVVVKDPDGSVARVHRFHNAFNGASTIASILAHASTTGRYWMTLSDTSGGGGPCGAGASPESCLVFEADDPNSTGAGWFGNLSVTTSSGNLVISGEIEATRNGQFNQVRMLLSRCGATTAPSACMPGAYGNFSARTLASPITLVAGQQAIVTVTYTFSAA